MATGFCAQELQPGSSLLGPLCLGCAAEPNSLHDLTAHAPSCRGQVGGFLAKETGNLTRLAPLWLQHTVSLRMDPDASRLAAEGRTPGRLRG